MACIQKQKKKKKNPETRKLPRASSLILLPRTAPVPFQPPAPLILSPFLNLHRRHRLIVEGVI
jgi:hypothetical protein